MSSIVVTAVFTPIEGRKTDLIDALRASIPAVHDERGCEIYALHDADNGSVIMVEKWKSRADLDDHIRGEAGAQLMRRIRELVVHPVTVTKMDSIGAGTSGQGAI